MGRRRGKPSRFHKFFCVVGLTALRCFAGHCFARNGCRLCGGCVRTRFGGWWEVVEMSDRRRDSIRIQSVLCHLHHRRQDNIFAQSCISDGFPWPCISPLAPSAKRVESSVGTSVRSLQFILMMIISRIPKAYQWAASYTATRERPLLDMSQGVPGIPPPPSLLESLGKSAASPRTCGYCPMTGEPMLKASLVQEMKSVYGNESDLSPDDVALTAGCNMAFVAAVMSVADAGDEVILPVPWYANWRCHHTELTH